MAKAGRQEITKARLNLQTERARLRDDQIALTREWEKLTRTKERMGQERAAAIAYLRRLCERYGDNEWPDDLPLAEILEHHLGDPLLEGMARVRRQMERLHADLRRAETQPPQQLQVIEGRALPARTGQQAPHTAPPEEVTKVLPMNGSRGDKMYQAVCSCRWVGPMRMRQDIADLDEAAHARTHTKPRRYGAAR